MISSHQPHWRLQLFEFLCAPAWAWVRLIGVALGVGVSFSRTKPPDP